MTRESWTYEELLTNGWYPHWEPGGPPYVLTFTFYRSENTIDSVHATGSTPAAAVADAEQKANAWLREYPHYKPRR